MLKNIFLENGEKLMMNKRCSKKMFKKTPPKSMTHLLSFLTQYYFSFKFANHLKNMKRPYLKTFLKKDPGIKMAVIPISREKSIVIESRREQSFSCKMPSKRNGVLAYFYDANLIHNENFLQPIVPTGRKAERSSNCSVAAYPNPILYKGEEILVEGLRLEVLDSANFDKIRISRIG